MTSLLCLLAIVGSSLGCVASTSAPPARSAPNESDVARVLDDWHDAAAHSDETRYFAHLTPDAIFIGTDATERWDVAAFRAYAHPRFAAGKGWVMHATSRHVSFAADGATAWFDEALDAKNLGAARGSGVLVRDAGGAWRIAHYVLSVTVPNEKFAAVKTLLEAP